MYQESGESQGHPAAARRRVLAPAPPEARANLSISPARERIFVELVTLERKIEASKDEVRHQEGQHEDASLPDVCTHHTACVHI